jgi:hypothetical protein
MSFKSAVGLLLCFLCTCFLLRVWMNHGAEARMAELVDKVKLCHNMDEVRALMGEPYEVYRYLPPKLGQDLVEKGDAAESVVFYAFTVQKMPPVFCCGEGFY